MVRDLVAEAVATIDEWLTKTRSRESRLGLLSCANPKAVNRIRERGATLETLRLVLNYIEQQPAPEIGGGVVRGFIDLSPDDKLRVQLALQTCRDEYPDRMAFHWMAYSIELNTGLETSTAERIAYDVVYSLKRKLPEIEGGK